MIMVDTRVATYTKRRIVEIQENTSRTCVDEQAAVPTTAAWESQSTSGTIAVRAAAPESSMIQKIPTQRASNHTRPVTAFFRRISMKITVKVRARPNAPKKARKVST
jgi:hypothetical protein